ncbi:MAG TPA: hypothetical protein DDZ61_22220 [Aeromonas salmonicida]|nr:hypothetical protein [Aeromonas salmonicida]HBL05267.1 hypothetical protein [Aeromonas salmonicida]
MAFDGPYSPGWSHPMSCKALLLPLLLGSLFVHASDMQPPLPDRPGAHMPPPSVLYQASKQSKDPQGTAQELFKNIPAAETEKRYEVVISVRELPPQAIRAQPTTAPLKGQ